MVHHPCRTVQIYHMAHFFKYHLYDTLTVDVVDVVAAEPATQEVIVSETRDRAVLGHPVFPVLITAVTKQPSLQTNRTHHRSNKTTLPTNIPYSSPQ